MKHNLPYILNLPPFTYRGVDFNSKSILFKVFFIIRGKLIGFIINNFKKNVFCNLINIFYPKKSKIYYKDTFYMKDIENVGTITYPNKRILRIVHHEDLLKRIYETYCLHHLEFSNGDIVIDCGANVGELYVSFLYNNINVDYIGIEPDSKTFECLTKNAKGEDNKFFKTALSNKIGKKEFYLDNYGGNSSLEKFDNVKSRTLHTNTIDNLDLPTKIKLLKLDAEGHELEVFQGAKGTLSNVEFIAVDYGFEKGLDQSSTIVEVNNFLLENNFELYKFSEYRLVGLYKNKMM